MVAASDRFVFQRHGHGAVGPFETRGRYVGESLADPLDVDQPEVGFKRQGAFERPHQVASGGPGLGIHSQIQQVHDPQRRHREGALRAECVLMEQQERIECRGSLLGSVEGDPELAAGKQVEHVDGE